MLLILVLIATTTTMAQSSSAKYGALAIDRSNGFYYGWSYDQSSLAEAENRAQQECTQRGGECSVVLAWSGSGCGAYRTIDGNVGTAYGWGLAATKEAADAIALRECQQRSNGKPAVNYVWSCNSTTSAPLKELKNDKQAIPAPSPVTTTAPEAYINFKGSKYTASGDCPGEGVAMITAEDESVMVLFNNAPSSGNATVNASFFTEGCTSCLGISVQDINNSLTYVAVSGSFSRSGNQVSFNVEVKEMFDLIEGTGSGFSVSGSFTCEE